VDDAMAGIERDNPALKGVLPKDYARPALDKQRLGQLIDMISNIKVGDEASRAKDVLGRVYEYFLSQFASAAGKKGGKFYIQPTAGSRPWAARCPTLPSCVTQGAE
jgi:type I restriction enzyme M protein